MAALEAQAPGRVRDVAAETSQAFPNDLALVGVERVPQWCVPRRRVDDACGRRQRGANVSGGDGIGRGQNERALDHVLELAHVPFPALLGEDLDSVRPELACGPVVAA